MDLTSTCYHVLSFEYCKSGGFTKIHLKVAYFHILIHPGSQKYLHFAFMKKAVQGTSLVLIQLPRCSHAWGTMSWVTSIVKESQCLLTSIIGWYITKKDTYQPADCSAANARSGGLQRSQNWNQSKTFSSSVLSTQWFYLGGLCPH